MNTKNPAARVKNMYIVAIVAIVFILIMHIIAWIPIISESSKVSEKSDEHLRESSGFYSYHNSDECSSCEEYAKEIAEYNKQGAELWQKTATYCVLIGIGGAVAYGVGALVEEKCLYTPDEEDEDC